MTPGHPDLRDILVIQLGDVGDVVLATPTFRALKEACPGARVFALVRRGYGSLLAADPNVAEVLETARSRSRLLEPAGNFFLARRLLRSRFDLVVDLRTGTRGAILALLARAPMKVAYAGDGARWRRFVFTRLLETLEVRPPPAHPGGDQSLRIVRAIGIDTADATPRLFVSPASLAAAREILSAAGVSPEGRWATVNPFSRWKYKEWRYDGWAEVIRWLRERHGIVSVVVGAPSEAEAAEAMCRRCAGAARSIAGKTSLGELAAALSLSLLHMGVDSAAPHVAAAVGTPTVTIFGPTDWRSWTVVDDAHRVVTPDRECVPCHRKGCEDGETSLCLEELGAGKVEDAIEGVLRSGAPGTRQRGAKTLGGQGPPSVR